MCVRGRESQRVGKREEEGKGGREGGWGREVGREGGIEREREREREGRGKEANTHSKLQHTSNPLQLSLQPTLQLTATYLTYEQGREKGEEKKNFDRTATHTSHTATHCNTANMCVRETEV